MTIFTPVESMPSNADFEFEVFVPSVFANERGTHESSVFNPFTTEARFYVLNAMAFST